MKNLFKNSLTLGISVYAMTIFMSCQKSAVLPAAGPSGKSPDQQAVAAAGENAAPSQHLFFTFPSDAILKMQKVKITKSANTEYFSVNNFAGGYNGLQQTPDKSFGTPNILIASLWDPNTAGKIYARVAYTGAGTVSSRFGGEGDGYKTINPYKWVLNTWYNIAIRSWKLNGELFVGTFIQNLSSGTWFHTSTLAIPERTQFLGSGNDAFLENWDGTNPANDGRFERKAFFKDCWNLNTSNVWQKHSSRSFSANANDAGRNGIYDRSFNAGYDATEDAYFMEHGGNVTPSAAFGTGRTLSLPDQTNQGSQPVLTVGSVYGVTAKYSGGSVVVNWNVTANLSPQFSSKVEILNASGTVIQTVNEVLPEKRKATITTTLGAGINTARVTITDIFNGVSAPVTVNIQ
ncbi:DUF3472 domain-containing protein [Pedobacter cryoconitis]|uniref:DUF3472 domain-containing protein n=1 Tax=Pedobacter cryoconitis TaxID=188932 RepID=A0A7X0J2P4_9SPHI|nr:DUF3472 domain-containing protein [Pedobacter cryoconitis]MBB6499986.1 hypothetical protein [Pedobacter cryoconitis]